MKIIYIFLASIGFFVGWNFYVSQQPKMYDHPTTVEAFCGSTEKLHPDCNKN